MPTHPGGWRLHQSSWRIFTSPQEPLFLEAAVEFWLGTRVVLSSQDIQLDPGRHTTLGPLEDLVDDHNVVHVVVVAVVVCVHFCFCERLLEICVKNFMSDLLNFCEEWIFRNFEILVFRANPKIHHWGILKYSVNPIPQIDGFWS
jgi:hypothetical protein